MGTTNYGNQRITFRYGMQAKSELFNYILFLVAPIGIYSGGILSKIDNTTVEISPFVSLIRDTATEVAVKVETQDPVQVTVSSAQSYLIIRYTWSNTQGNYADILSVEKTNLLSDDIIIGRAVFDAGILSTTFDYVERQSSVLQDAEDKRLNLKVLPTEPPSNKVLISTGDIRKYEEVISISEQESPTFGSGFPGTVDAVYIDVDGSIGVLKDIDVNDPDEDYGTKLVLVEIDRDGQDLITGDLIRQVTYEFFPLEFFTEDEGSFAIGVHDASGDIGADNVGELLLDTLKRQYILVDTDESIQKGDLIGIKDNESNIYGKIDFRTYGNDFSIASNIKEYDIDYASTRRTQDYNNSIVFGWIDSSDIGYLSFISIDETLESFQKIDTIQISIDPIKNIMLSSFFHEQGDSQSRKRILVSYQKTTSPDLYFKIFELDGTNSIVIYRSEEVISIGATSHAFCFSSIYKFKITETNQTYISYFWIDPISDDVYGGSFELNSDFTRTPVNKLNQPTSENVVITTSFSNGIPAIHKGWSLGLINDAYYQDYSSKGIIVERYQSDPLTSTSTRFFNIPIEYFSNEWDTPYQTLIGDIDTTENENLSYSYDGIGLINSFLGDFNVSVGEWTYYYGVENFIEGRNQTYPTSKPYTSSYEYNGLGSGEFCPMKISDIEIVAVNTSGYMFSSVLSQQADRVVYDFGYSTPLKFIDQLDDDIINIREIRSHRPYKGYLYPVPYIDSNDDLKFKMVKNINYLGIAAKDVDENNQILFISSSSIILDNISSGNQYYADKINQTISTSSRGNEFIGFSAEENKLELR